MRRALAATLALAGCVSSVDVVLPVPPEVHTAVIVRGPPGYRTLQAYAAGALRGGYLALALPPEQTVIAFFRASPAELGFGADPIPEVDEGRPLPPVHSAFAVGGDGVASPLDPAALAGIRLPRLEWDALLRAGRCAKAGADTPAFDVDLTCARGRDVSPTPPMPPAPPELGVSCPSGWGKAKWGFGAAPVESRTATVCLPPAAVTSTCPRGERQPAHLAACAPISAACPADGWPEGIAPAGARWVKADAPPGDGTKDAPHASLREALEAAVMGSTVAVGAGVYRENVRVPAGVHVVGACARGVEVRAAQVGPTLQVEGGGSTLRGLRVAGAIAIQLGATASARLREVDVEGAVQLEGAELVASASRFHGTVTAAGAKLTLQDVELTTSTVAASGRGAVVVLTGVALRRRSVVRASEGALVRMLDTVLDAPSAVELLGAGTRVSLTDVAIRDPIPGLGCDLPVDEMDPGAPRGTPICARDAATLEARRVAIAATTSTARALLRGTGRAALDLADVAFRAWSMDGISVGEQATLQLARAFSYGSGLRLERSGPSRIEDAAIHSTAQSALEVRAAADLTVARLRAVGTNEDDVKLFKVVGATFTDVRAGAGTRTGILLTEGSDAAFTRTAIERATRVGFEVRARSRARVEDLTITSSPFTRCASCFGALRIVDEATVDLTRFVIRQADAAGIWLGRDCTLCAADGIIEGAQFGVIVDEDRDPSPLLIGVHIRDVMEPLGSPTEIRVGVE